MKREGIKKGERMKGENEGIFNIHRDRLNI